MRREVDAVLVGLPPPESQAARAPWAGPPRSGERFATTRRDERGSLGQESRVGEVGGLRPYDSNRSICSGPQGFATCSSNPASTALDTSSCPAYPLTAMSRMPFTWDARNLRATS